MEGLWTAKDFTVKNFAQLEELRMAFCSLSLCICLFCGLRLRLVVRPSGIGWNDATDLLVTLANAKALDTVELRVADWIYARSWTVSYSGTDGLRVTPTTTVLRPLYMSAGVSWRAQLRTGGFCGMLLLTAAIAFGLRRRCLSSPQRCYLQLNLHY